MDDFEVSSRRVSPDQQVVQGMMKTLPEGNTSMAQGPGTDNEGPEQSGQRETILLQEPLETQMRRIY